MERSTRLTVCHGALRRIALEHPFQHALALFMQVAGYPCRHIISVAVARGERIKTSFFNDRLERDQVPFIEGRNLASVN